MSVCFDGSVILYGVGSTFLADIEASLTRLHVTVVRYVSNVSTPPALTRDTVVPSEIPDAILGLPCVVAVITPGHRRAIAAELDSLNLDNRPPLLDPTAIVATSADIEEGVYVNAGSVIGGDARLERFSTVNRSASIGHHSIIEAYAAVGPGATIPAAVTVGTGSFVGSGAVLLPRVTIGRNAVVGAGAVVVKDVEPNTVVVGNPARVIRHDIVGYNDVGVA